LYIFLLTGFASFQAYANSWKSRKPATTPAWWQSSSGRFAITVIDFLSFILTGLIGFGGFTVLVWWKVILTYIAAGLLLAPLIPSEKQPFTTATFCALETVCEVVMREQAGSR
jgi:hypothetical protein